MSKDLVVPQDTVAKLRALTGEDNGGGGYESYPTIEVNNKSTEREVDIDGVKTVVKVPPEKMFMLSQKNSAGEYEKVPFVDSFDGIIMAVRYQVDKKYSESDTTPWFTSREFDSFFEDIELHTKEGSMWSGDYKRFKSEFEGRYVLYLVLYVSIDGKIYKTKFKGKSRSNYWDYMKEVKKANDSVANRYTIFGLTQEDSPVGKFNAVKYLHANAKTVDINEVLPAIESLKATFSKKPERVDVGGGISGEVVMPEEVNFND